MNDQLQEPFISYWYRALTSAHGVEIVCSNVDLVRAKLYAARREAQDPDLEAITVSISPFDPTKLWLRKRPVNETDAAR